MGHPAPSEPGSDARVTVERYLAFFGDGVLTADDRVETSIARGGTRIELAALPGAAVAVDDLLPRA